MLSESKWLSKLVDLRRRHTPAARTPLARRWAVTLGLATLRLHRTCWSCSTSPAGTLPGAMAWQQTVSLVAPGPRTAGIARALGAMRAQCLRLCSAEVPTSPLVSPCGMEASVLLFAMPDGRRGLRTMLEHGVKDTLGAGESQGGRLLPLRARPIPGASHSHFGVTSLEAPFCWRQMCAIPPLEHRTSKWSLYRGFFEEGFYT